jgi:hypothetical protein
MVLSIKLSDGTPNAQIFVIANIPYITLVFHVIRQVHDQFYAVCYKQ